MSRPWLGLVAVVAMFAFALAVYPALPERIPTHWNVAGEADAWAAKWPWAFLMPGMGLVLLGLLWLLPRIDPRREHYGRFWDTYWLIANLLLVYFLLVEIFLLGSALGWPIEVDRVMLLGIGLLFMALGNYLPRVKSNWWMGIRTPWTLESERVWRETHRLGGRTFVAGGLITMAGALLPQEWRPYAAIAGITVAGFVPVVYSYVAWRRERRQHGR